MAVVVSVGPWGAPGGEPRDIPIGSMPQSLVSITIWSIKALGGPICGFSYVYVDQNGGPIHVGPWGNADPEHTITNIQMGPGEYLYELSGTADDSALLSLKLVTNQHTYEVGAPLEQTTFSMPLKNGKVVAFFGRSDNDHLTALGIYVPVMKGSPVNVGPWGDSGGVPVDITTPVQLKSVTVYSTDSSDGRIYGFSFTYVDLTGQSIHVGPWGTIKGEKHTVRTTLIHS
ncbi:protein GOS9-like [Lolium perenne]|uniref:protein GOS9-like n=1 Tax=Lolium perenne TaxID=4522 RepID=UPI003A997045